MRPRGSANVLEARRRRALALLSRGLSLNAAARQVGCAPSSVMRWRDAVRRHGPAGLTVRPTPGRPTKLSALQQHRLVRLLRVGAMAHGYETDAWTSTRIVEVIEQTFGVRYHRDHVARLMNKLGSIH
jgi:transposase